MISVWGKGTEKEEKKMNAALNTILILIWVLLFGLTFFFPLFFLKEGYKQFAMKCKISDFSITIP